MSRKHQDEGAILVERSWPPPRIWGYLLLPAVIAAIPAPFLGVDYWAAVGGLVGGLLFIFVFGSVMAAARHWWVTPDELRLDRVPLLVRVLYGFSGRQRVPLEDIQQVKTLEGSTRAVEKEAFGGRPPVREALGGSCERFWCKGHVVARLRQPDEYGDVVLLSTNRPQEASNTLIKAINDEQQRRGTAP